MKTRLFVFASFFLYVFPAKSFSQNLDIDILKPINLHATWLKTNYLELCVSSVSDLSLGTPVTVFAYGLLKHDRQTERDGIYMAVAYLASGIVVQTTKRLYDRERPYQQYAFIVKRDDESGGTSFPSGHTTAAFCTAGSLAFRFPKWYVIAPAYVWATCVGWGRMYQGVHYPSDVLAGAIIGTGAAWAGYELEKCMNKKHPVVKNNIN
jgi:membrane-associated phospholipid phosphatase